MKVLLKNSGYDWEYSQIDSRSTSWLHRRVPGGKQIALLLPALVMFALTFLDSAPPTAPKSLATSWVAAR